MRLVANIVAGLGTYAGRDACIRVVSYFALFLYGLIKLAQVGYIKANDSDGDDDDDNDNHEHDSFLLQIMFQFLSIEAIVALEYSLLLISKQFALTRLINRFFDDIPAVYNLFKHLSKGNENKKVRDV
jgi:hypothetical protein